MENSYDLNLIRCDFIKHREWKTPNNRASESSVDKAPFELTTLAAHISANFRTIDLYVAGLGTGA
jgi:hypothetical protein